MRPASTVSALRCASRNRSATATLDVTATEPGPLVAVNTIDVDGQGHRGMRIGSQFYQDPANGMHLQIVVLDRNTLELPSQCRMAVQHNRGGADSVLSERPRQRKPGARVDALERGDVFELDASRAAQRGTGRNRRGTAYRLGHGGRRPDVAVLDVQQPLLHRLRRSIG